MNHPEKNHREKRMSDQKEISPAEKKTFDIVIEDVQIVNVFSEQVQEGNIAINGDTIVYVGPMEFAYQARKRVEGKHRFCVPGFLDSHMHIESSMMTPAHFAEVALACGTTTVAPDPHEITNVCGLPGLKAFAEAAEGLPLHVYMAAPSTIPSAPGRERSGFSVEENEMEQMLDLPGICSMGELMDFNAVADGDERILSVIAAARRRGVPLDGHVPVLSGERLQAFRATGIDADHTYMDVKVAEEKLSLGFCIQVQSIFYTKELMEFLNRYPVQNRIMLVTDDVPFIRLMREGHLNASVRKAVALGLDPLKAIRYVTINAADRMRLYDRGGLCPGRKADILIMPDLVNFTPDLVLSDGQVVAENGRCRVALQGKPFPKDMYSSVYVTELFPEDFAIRADGTRTLPGAPFAGPDIRNGVATACVAVSDGKTARTQLELRELPVRDGCLVTDGLIRVAVIYRHGYRADGSAVCEERQSGGIDDQAIENASSGSTEETIEQKNQRRKAGEKEGLHAGKEVSLGLYDILAPEGAKPFHGAIAVTYAHDSHNLVIYGSAPEDMALAGNRLISSGGGLCAVQDGQVLSEIPLPIAGLLCEESSEVLRERFETFLAAVDAIHVNHADPMSFLTLMALAVSPNIKCTDMGLLDTAKKCFVPLITDRKEIPV